MRAKRQAPTRGRWSWVLAGVLMFLAVFCLRGAAAQTHGGHVLDPLAPPDLTSPRATMSTFIDETTATIDLMRAGYATGMRTQAERAFAALDMEMKRGEGGFDEMIENTFMLLEVLAKLDLPPSEDMPGAEAVAGGLRAWTIPETEIRLISTVDEEGEVGPFRFSPETVARIGEFYQRMRPFPATGTLRAYGDIVERFRLRPGFAAPAAFGRFIHDLPPAWLTLIGNMPIWKWVALLATLLLAGGVAALVYRLVTRLRGRPAADRSERWSGPLLTLFTLALIGIVNFIGVEVIRVTDTERAVFEALMIVGAHLTLIWLIFQLFDLAASLLIRVRELGVASLDTQLVRLLFRLASVLLGLYVLVHLADSLGVPVTPMLAGLGVGGLAVALAVRPTLENIVAGFVLFADKPVKVGEFCQFGDKMGTVEAVGLRSVRVRGLDRTLVSVPNAEFCQMQIVNFTRRDSILLKSLIGLRYETTADQLRLVLVRLRELLIRHPKVAIEPARVRFVGYGAFSLDLEIFAYVTTRDFGEFLAIQEDINLRIKDIVERIGAGFAFPSQTLYLERSAGVGPEQAEAAGLTVERWRQENRLPFPNHEEQFRYELADTLDYPPRGSPGANAVP